MTDRAREMLKALGEYTGGSDRCGQMDQEVVDQCIVLAVKSDLSADDVKKLLDDCVCYSLCTDFVVSLLDLIWRDLGGHR
jgi:hypothetical protein